MEPDRRRGPGLGLQAVRVQCGPGSLQTETGTITSSTYDAAGRLKTRMFTNGIVETKIYSPERGWIEHIQTQATNGSQDLTYAYYHDGMIQSITSVNGFLEP